MSSVQRGALSFAIFGAWCTLIYFQSKVAFCVGVAAMCAHGVVGAYQRKITVRGKFGPGKTYVGSAAVREGVFIVFVSLVFGLVGALAFWLLPTWRL